jgi:hypothetical protein
VYAGQLNVGSTVSPKSAPTFSITKQLVKRRTAATWKNIIIEDDDDDLDLEKMVSPLLAATNEERGFIDSGVIDSFIFLSRDDFFL